MEVWGSNLALVIKKKENIFLKRCIKIKKMYKDAHCMLGCLH